MQMYSFTKNSFDVIINHIYEDCGGFNKNTKVQFEKLYVLENVNIAVQDFKQKWQFVKFYFCLLSNQVVHQYVNFIRFFNFWKFTTFSKFTTFAPPLLIYGSPDE